MSGFKKTSDVPVKGYNGFKNFDEIKYDDVVATGKDAFGKTTKWVIPKGYDSVDDFLNKNSRNTIRNQKLANSSHPTTNASYDALGLPTFDEKNIKFKCDLKGENMIDTDYNQFTNCTKQLKEKMNKGEISKGLFTEQQLKDIEAEKNIINGLTWHHDKVTGKMQLVDFDVHSKTGHLGGNNIWGEGVRSPKDLKNFNDKNN